MFWALFYTNLEQKVSLNLQSSLKKEIYICLNIYMFRLHKLRFTALEEDSERIRQQARHIFWTFFVLINVIVTNFNLSNSIR